MFKNLSMHIPFSRLRGFCSEALIHDHADDIGGSRFFLVVAHDLHDGDFFCLLDGHIYMMC